MKFGVAAAVAAAVKFKPTPLSPEVPTGPIGVL
jgi:hypothetical protein